jgi:hypothetical protein
VHFDLAFERERLRARIGDGLHGQVLTLTPSAKLRGRVRESG